MNKMRNLLGIICVILFYSCASEYDKTIAVQIGNLKVTNYEFQRELKKAFPKTEKRNDKALLKWKKEYLDKCYVLADAYEKQYDTIQDIKTELHYVSQLMMVQQYGYLWNKTVTPVVDAFMATTEEKKQKRSKVYCFDYIVCDNMDAFLKEFNNDSLLNDSKEYNQLKGKCNQYHFLNTGSVSLKWPFISFWEHRDYMSNLKEGEVSKLIHNNSNKSYFFYLDHIETIEPTEKDLHNMQMELKIGKEEDVDKEKTIEMIDKGQPHIFEASLDTIMEFLNQGNSLRQFNQDIPLIKYKLNDSVKTISSKTFTDYYYSLPMRNKLSDRETLIWYVNQIYYDDYLSAEAEKLGLFRDEGFLLDQKIFLNRLYYNEYLHKEIMAGISIDSADVVKYYEDHIVEYTNPKAVKAHLYYFDSVEMAINNSNTLIELLKNQQIDKTIDSSLVIGLKKASLNKEFSLENKTSTSEEMMTELLALTPGQLSSTPLFMENKFVMLYKVEEIGKSIIDLSKVYSVIERKLVQHKTKKALQDRVAMLQNKYTMDVNEIEL